MKAIFVALIGACSAISMKQQYLVSGGRNVQEGIDDKSLMDRQPSHWRKIWPQGLTDDGNNDVDVLNW